MRRTVRKMRDRTCQICGTVHQVFAHMPDGTRGVFCSANCKKENARRLRGKQCAICGKQFIAKSGKQFITQQCCSNKCRGRHRSGLEKASCATCGSETKSTSAKYCSVECSLSRHSVKLVRGKVEPVRIVVGQSSKNEGEWDKAISVSMKRLSNKRRKDEDGWGKRINAGVSSLMTRKRRGQLEAN